VSRLTQRLPDRVDDRGEERECESPEDEGCREDEQRVVAGTCCFLAEEHAGEADADVVLAFVTGSDERAGVGDDGDAQTVGLGDHDQVCGEVAERSGVADHPVAGEFINHPAESLAGFEGGVPPGGLDGFSGELCRIGGGEGWFGIEVSVEEPCEVLGGGAEVAAGDASTVEGELDWPPSADPLAVAGRHACGDGMVGASEGVAHPQR
jgi:hypothetical protein